MSERRLSSRAALVAGLAFALLGAPYVAEASPFDEVRGGVLVQGLGPFSPNKEDGAGINAELVFGRLADLKSFGVLRPNLGLTVATGDYGTSQIYGGLLWDVDFSRHVFLSAGLGVAIHDGETSFNPPDPLINERSYLGCRALIHISADVGYRLTERVSAMIHVDHMSNAGICSENEGLDNTGLRLGYRF